MKLPDGIAERFWSRVDMSAGPDGCWQLGSQRRPLVYPTFSYQMKTYTGHKLALLLSGQTIEPGQLVMHSCDHSWCVNPAHLSAGTPKENAQDRQRKGRQRGGWWNSHGPRLDYDD